jgi:hypothetical protein
MGGFVVTIFALTLVFADGYLGGSTHARDFKDLASCNRYGAQMAMQMVNAGHQTSFVCAETKPRKAPAAPVVHEMKTLPAG